MVRELESRKDLVDEKVTRHDDTRHCEERSDEAIHSIDCRVGLRPPRNDEYRSNPPTLTLPANASRVTRLVPRLFPLLRTKVNSAGWGLCGDNSQSLIHDKNLTSCASELRARLDGGNDVVIADVNRRPVKCERVRNRLNVLTTSKKVAFTLAEVLITLGVIGVVAAMTIPTLVNKYKTQVNVVKIKKFYSMFNQAIKLSEVDNGPIDNWILNCAPAVASTCTIDEVEAWYNNYLGKYIKSLKIEKNTRSGVIDGFVDVYLPDGSFFSIRQNIGDVNYSPDGKKGKVFGFILSGKNRFAPSEEWENCSNNYLDTYCYNWDGTREGLLEGRNFAKAAAKNDSGYCSKLLQYDGWVVKDDNPCTYY